MIQIIIVNKIWNIYKVVEDTFYKTQIESFIFNLC
jgi:hypothetical protein